MTAPAAAPAAPAEVAAPVAPVTAAPAPVAAAAPVQAPVAVKVAPQAAVSAASAEMPKVTSFELPLNDLAQVAQGSGLSWVNSDPAKIAAVQAAIAAEPKPVRVPRERPPAAPITEGPLVLVETKRDLRNMNLPFEEKSGS